MLFIQFLTYVSKWIPEITHHCPNVAFVLVGTQIDLRADKIIIQKLDKNITEPISTADGEKLGDEVNAVEYVECSALTQVRYYMPA